MGRTALVCSSKNTTIPFYNAWVMHIGHKNGIVPDSQTPSIDNWQSCFQGYNDKVWQELPETCKELPETKCIKVDRVRNVKEKYTKCDQEPYEDCKQVPEERCVPITKQKCEDVPYQDCNDVTTEVCEEKHFQVSPNKDLTKEQ